jgi:CxxC-x17-CxxC domain-containing protein
MSFRDKTLVCKQCGQQFIFSAREQEFYSQKGLTFEPKRCKDCRSLKKANQSRENKNYPKQLFDAICAKCGIKTQVPFQPVQGRSVYCKQCYQQLR